MSVSLTGRPVPGLWPSVGKLLRLRWTIWISGFRRAKRGRKIGMMLLALLALAGPATLQPWADDAHHPEKAATAKKPGKARPKAPQKKPAVKPDTSKQSGLPSPRV